MIPAHPKSTGIRDSAIICGSVPSDETCPICESGCSAFYARIDDYDYFCCGQCGSLHIDKATLDAIDAGRSTRIYDEIYWAEELKAARERAAGESLVRAGEAILYARRPVRRFLDIGAGPGYLLDALAGRFPSYGKIFHGVELFPPEKHSRNPNYLVGKAGDLDGNFDAGVCIEVVEHLTPRMLQNLARELSRISAPQTLWLFNTGMPDLVKRLDPGYLDPRHRGHIVSYGLSGIRHIFEPNGFRICQVPGKNYAWIAEFETTTDGPSFEDRIAHPVPENRALLEECALVYQAALESARASVNLSLMEERSRWAIATDTELNMARKLYSSLQEEHEEVAKWAHVLQAELAELRERHVALQRDYTKILSSRSWRLTYPLRRIMSLLRIAATGKAKTFDGHQY